MNTDDWEEGSPYTAGLVIRGSKTPGTRYQPNQVIAGKHEGAIVMPYVVWVDPKYKNELKDNTNINSRIETKMNE